MTMQMTGPLCNCKQWKEPGTLSPFLLGMFENCRDQMILLDQPRKNLSKVLEVITFPMIHRVNEQQGNKVKAHPAPHVQKTLSHHDKTQRQTVT